LRFAALTVCLRQLVCRTVPKRCRVVSNGAVRLFSALVEGQRQGLEDFLLHTQSEPDLLVFAMLL
jgi:hypothetical protein